MKIDLTVILVAVLDLIAALITYKLIPWIQSKTTAQQQQNLDAVYCTLVFAAEQLYGANHGAEKLAYVKERLRERGYDVDVPTIEATVKRLFNYNLAVPIEKEEAKDDSPSN